MSSKAITGRDLIMYILRMGLEDAPIINEDGTLVGFMPEEEFAIKMGTGVHTVRAWVSQGVLTGVKIGDKLYIPGTLC